MADSSTDVDAIIGKNLVRLRGDRSQQEIADGMRHVGWKWSQATVWSVEKGERPLRLAEALSLAKLLFVRLDDLIMQELDGMVIVGLIARMTAIRESRESLRANIQELAKHRDELIGAIAFAEESLASDSWTDEASKIKAETLLENAREIASWSLRRVTEYVLTEEETERGERGGSIDGEHPEA
ncbi:helix-turn-helix domain-containing protein [Paenarthrobacter sp. AR 02]|uniref:helix-turn-helix domain-containing protein n=1 Tax=Paenarthrobacter sp. AR 02 TaxID=2899821 RepID=UPI001F31462E|nr:helix-turn-helix transcriptional regulator [Paenarthrobacter sp. AR 02]MCF3137668.1 helix-turn-helix domain-containing protein [Paenarthrobacter sp. AR 02]